MKISKQENIRILVTCVRIRGMRGKKKNFLSSHCNPCHFCSKGKPIGREKSKNTFVWINGIRGRKISKYHYVPCYFHTCLQFLENSLKNQLVYNGIIWFTKFCWGLVVKHQKIWFRIVSLPVTQWDFQDSYYVLGVTEISSAPSYVRSTQ